MVLDAAFLCLDRLAQRYLLQVGSVVRSHANKRNLTQKCEASIVLAAVARNYLLTGLIGLSNAFLASGCIIPHAFYCKLQAPPSH